MKYNGSPKRNAPLEMTGKGFRKAGHVLIDLIAEFLDSIPHRPVTGSATPKILRKLLNDPIPENGSDVLPLLSKTSELLFEHSLLNGHPRFWGYITSSAAPIGALGEMLAASVNPNAGAFALSPIATEIERQTIQWLAQWIGYPSTCGGIFVSGGNMANFVGFLAARKNKVDWDIRKEGLRDRKQLTVYCPKGTHTWVEKATDLFGLGTESIRWIDTDESQRLIADLLSSQIERDRKAGLHPFMVVGNGGSVSTGAVDSFPQLARICKAHNMWFHIDGAYGVPACMLSENKDLFNGLDLADSIALDPHKWLYSPLEAGCILVRNKEALHDTFNFHPEYYKFDGTDEDPVTNFHEYGLQNSRGFRALKVWLGMKQAGRKAYVKMIRDDIGLARSLFEIIQGTEGLEAVFNSLSITVFRYLPTPLENGAAPQEEYVNRLNEVLVTRLQESGEAYLSNAVINGKYCLRVCIVNFRTALSDIRALPEIVLRMGRAVDNELRMDRRGSFR